MHICTVHYVEAFRLFSYRCLKPLQSFLSKCQYGRNSPENPILTKSFRCKDWKSKFVLDENIHPNQITKYEMTAFICYEMCQWCMAIKDYFGSFSWDLGDGKEKKSKRYSERKRKKGLKSQGPFVSDFMWYWWRSLDTTRTYRARFNISCFSLWTSQFSSKLIFTLARAHRSTHTQSNEHMCQQPSIQIDPLTTVNFHIYYSTEEIIGKSGTACHKHKLCIRLRTSILYFNGIWSGTCIPTNPKSWNPYQQTTGRKKRQIIILYGYHAMAYWVWLAIGLTVLLRTSIPFQYIPDKWLY